VVNRESHFPHFPRPSLIALIALGVPQSGLVVSLLSAARLNTLTSGFDVARRKRWRPKAALQIVRQDKQYECGQNEPLRHKEGAWPKQPLKNPKDENKGRDKPNPPANSADLWSK